MLTRIRTLLGLSNTAVTYFVVGAGVSILSVVFWNEHLHRKEQKEELYAAHAVAGCLQLHVKDPEEIIRSKAPTSRKAEIAPVSARWIIRLSPRGRCDYMTWLQLPGESARPKVFLVRHDFLIRETSVEKDGTRWYIVGDMPQALQPRRPQFA